MGLRALLRSILAAERVESLLGNRGWIRVPDRRWAPQPVAGGSPGEAACRALRSLCTPLMRKEEGRDDRPSTRKEEGRVKLKEVFPSVLLMALCVIFVKQAPANPIPVGACCFGDGSCQVLPEPDCLELGGAFNGAGSCNPNPCPQLGACCYADGSCVIVLPADCIAQFLGATSCDPNPCPPCFVRCGGVCCLGDGTCQLVPEGQCVVNHGLWMPDVWVCNPNPCGTSGIPEPRMERQTWGRIKALYKD
jgi:hypothetical protein